MRFKVLLATLALAVMSLAVTSVASAGAQNGNFSTAPDPQTTNVPYVAWIGEQVRVMKCLNFRDDVTEAQRLQLQLDFSANGTFQVEDWTGVDEVNAGPRWLNGQIGFNSSTRPVEINENGICWSAHLTSQKPGMAVVKLAVSLELLLRIEAEFGDLLEIGVGDISLFHAMLLKHQFLVIFLQANAPVINEVANADYPDLDLGDPLGDGIFNFGEPFGANPGLVRIQVSGTFPLGNDYAGLGMANVTLPDQWVELANLLAVDDDPQAGARPGSAAWRWDIHDDRGTLADHAGDNACTPRAGNIDAVDNCWPGGGDEFGPFSHFWGYSSFDTIGPFDPVRGHDTFLGDNNLTDDDAPMPHLRVDVAIAPGGFGGLEKADKDDIYDRDNSNDAGGEGTAHDLYAPFYKSFLPAAPAGTSNSGVAGSFIYNNYPGFLSDGLYDYWSIRGFTDDPLRNRDLCRDELGNWRTSPTGYDYVVVYTDEHGEAFVAFNPDTGFNFTVINGICDLDYAGPRSFTAEITAESVYPDQPVLWEQSAKVSNTLTKVANIAAAKYLQCVPKTGVFNTMYCVETILDIYGNPVAGAPVRFSRTPRGNIEPAAIDDHPPFDTTGQELVSQDNEFVTLRTNEHGQAGVFITESLDICVDVKAENLATAPGPQRIPVMRFIEINPNDGTICNDDEAGFPPTTTPPGNGGDTGGNTGGNTGGTPTGSGVSQAAAPTATIVSLTNTVAPAAKAPAAKAPAKKKAVKAKLLRARLLVAKGGKQYLAVKVKSPLKTAKIRVQLIQKNGKSRFVTRTVKTNRLVRVPNLKFNKNIKRVKVAVLASAR